MARALLHRDGGLSLVDLMVGLAIGLAATLVILHVAVMFDARRRIASGGADAQVNITQATALLARGLRIAGNGLGPLETIGCTVHRSTAMPEATLDWRPVTITQGASGAPDTVTVLASGTPATPPARLIAPYTVGVGAMTVDSTLELRSGDGVLLHAPGIADCPLLKIDSVAIGAFSVRPADTGVLAGAVFGIGSKLINVGVLHRRRYSVDAAQRLQVEVFDTGTGTWAASTLADGIVSLQLQYGFDTRPGTQPAPRVTAWSDNAIDADGNGQAGDAGDWRRLLAVRVAVVARSPQRREGACDAAAPQWREGGVDGKLQPVTISLAHLPDWRCWRYRVLQAEVLLRNQLWSEP